MAGARRVSRYAKVRPEKVSEAPPVSMIRALATETDGKRCVYVLDLPSDQTPLCLVAVAALLNPSTTLDEALARVPGSPKCFTWALKNLGFGSRKSGKSWASRTSRRCRKRRPTSKGVINLRGKAIPVVDLRLKLGLPEQEY